MTRSTDPILRVSWALVCRRAFLAPVLLALALVAATVPVLDDGYGVQVLRGVGVLLACGWLLATDDPAGEVLAASPYPRVVRSAGRVLAGGAVVLPAWVASAAVVERAAPDVPVRGLGLEALALGILGLALGLGIRAWREEHRPSQLAGLGLLGLVLGSNALPRWYTLQPTQSWGPPWEAAQIRWAAVLLLAVAVAALALRDPLAGRGRSRPHDHGRPRVR